MDDKMMIKKWKQAKKLENIMNKKTLKDFTDDDT